MKTRRGRKRTSPKPLENEECDSEEKKPKLNSENFSKYFVQPSNSSHEQQKLEGHSINNDDCVGVKKLKQTIKLESESDDESSSDEFMKVPFSLDDLGDFESLKKESTSTAKENKICAGNGTSRLSDESGEDDMKIGEEDYYDFSQIIQTQELLINTKKELEEKKSCTKESILPKTRNKKKLRKTTKEKDVKFANNEPIDEELGISELLAITEGRMMVHKSDNQCSDEDKPDNDKYSVPEEGVQVTIQLPNLKHKKKTQGFDVEAAMKRRLNLIRKENQVLMHKVHTLCWIAHGLYLNRTINSNDLMGLALSLIPSKHCYPSKHADLNYLEKLVEWFIGKVIIDQDHQLALNSLKQPLTDVLEIEIKSKKAFSKRDLVLMFVCMVRSLGIDARLVISFRSVPIRPPASDLCSVSNTKSSKSINDTKSKKLVSTSNTDKKVVQKPSIKIQDNIQLKETSNINIIKDTQQIQPSTNNISNKIKRGDKRKNSASVNKLNSEIISPYFSSSDDVPLIEIQRKCNSRNKCSTSNKSQNTTTKNNSSKTKMSLNISKCNKNVPTNFDNYSGPYSQSNSTAVSEKKNSCPSEFPTKISGRSKRISCDLVVDQNNLKQKEELLNRQTKVSKNRKSAPSYHELNTTSEDEVEIPRRTNKKETISRKLNSSNSELSNNNLSPTNKKEKRSKNNSETQRTISKKKSIDRRVLSSDDENSDNSKKIGNDFWAEVYLEAEEKWISVDLIKGKVHCIHQLYNRATQPVRYIIAFNNDGSAKDVTRRYAPQWLTVTRRMRVDDNWWRETIAPYSPRRTIREKDEDEDLDRQLHDKPLPTSVTEYKNHPLYALRRHLLKFEAIYPPDAPPLGFVRGEPVYSRGCVADLHTRETWIKEAKLVRRGEEPYKIVKARPKWDKVSQKVINDLPLPLFGHWQVEDYIPPPAVDGKVPRNEYGNVELYKPCMLPVGTVHLQVPQLARVARKLNIDCAPAVVGWEFSGGGSHPVLDGFIVCEEFKEVLLDAWDKEMDESAKRAKEKVEQRVYGNWKRLIKGLLIRERLKLRYDFGVPEPKKKKQPSKPGTSKS